MVEPDGSEMEEAFGAALREQRQRRNWTQQDLVDRVAELGVSLHQSGIARIEAGTRPVRLHEALTLARVLAVDLQDLLPDLAVLVQKDVAVLEAMRHDAADALDHAHARRSVAEADVHRAMQAFEAARAALQSAEMQAGRAAGEVETRRQSLMDLDMRVREARMRLSKIEDQQRRREER
jgi:transcriptional regulator with XRE-family HTH domain